jgi:hypothetical protein
MPKRRGRAKVGKVMGEFKRRTLHSSSGQKVTSRDQAVAIAMSEAGMSRKDRRRGPKRRARSGGNLRRVRSA